MLKVITDKSKYRNVFGTLEYSIGEFFVTHHRSCDRKYVIMKRYPWMISDAVLKDCFLSAPEFETWIQACLWLNKNVNELL